MPDRDREERLRLGVITREDITTFCFSSGISYHGTMLECPSCYPDNAKKAGVVAIRQPKEEEEFDA
jgi:hypothetical protein